MVGTERNAAFAVLIDADNASARNATAIFEEIATFGEAMVRRIYGDFARDGLKSWDRAVQEHAILQQQQRNNTTGKNAADIALVIDAMDLLYKGTLDGVCLVSSDSDFTRLAQRLREEGLTVIGIGEKKAPEAFRNACNRFIYVENLAGDAGSASHAAPKKEAAGKAVPLIRRAIAALEDDDGWVRLGAVGQKLLSIAPDFDTRTYGEAKLSTLVQKSGGFEMKRGEGNHLILRQKPEAQKKPATRKAAAKKA